MVLRARNDSVLRKTLNSNIRQILNWKWPKLCSDKLPQLGEKQRRAAKLSTSHRKSMSLNPLTDLRPEVELMHLVRMRRQYCHVKQKALERPSKFA